jgi:hypothetical protein
MHLLLVLIYGDRCASTVPADFRLKCNYGNGAICILFRLIVVWRAINIFTGSESTSLKNKIITRFLMRLYDFIKEN